MEKINDDQLAELQIPLTEAQVAELVKVTGILGRRLAFERDALKKTIHGLQVENERLRGLCEAPFRHRSDCPCNGAGTACACHCGFYGTNNADPHLPLMD